MTRTLADTLRWVEAGTSLVASAVDGLAWVQYAQASILPGWTRAHLVAHLAANAAAIRNLTYWAATGEETPMYSSLAQRNTDIEMGATRPPPELRTWFHDEAAALANALESLTVTQWKQTVRTAQGRDVPAAEVPWLRAREVMVHTVDLGVGVTFSDLPKDFLAELEVDILGKRGVDAPDVSGSLADRVGYLAGRTRAGVAVADGCPAPALGPWL